ELGLVASLSRPGGNVTGATTLNVELSSKRLELLHELLPATTAIAVLINPTNPNIKTELGDLGAAARSIGRRMVLLQAQTEAELEAAFASLAPQQAGALLVNTDAFFFSRRNQLIALAKRHAVPAIFDRREFAVRDGLMSYGGSVTDIYRLAGIYAGRILK